MVLLQMRGLLGNFYIQIFNAASHRWWAHCTTPAMQSDFIAVLSMSCKAH